MINYFFEVHLVFNHFRRKYHNLSFVIVNYEFQFIALWANLVFEKILPNGRIFC